MGSPGGLKVKAKAPQLAYGTRASSLAALRGTKLPFSDALARDIEALFNGLNYVVKNIRETPAEITDIYVTDSNGNVVAAFGDHEFSGELIRNYMSELHVGGAGDPTYAVLDANPDGSVTIGRNGRVLVLDAFDAEAAWLGSAFDTLPIAGAVNAGGLIKLTVTAHPFVTGDEAAVEGVVGVENANGTFTLTVVDADHVTLQSSVFAGSYVSGGTITRVLHVAGAADSGSGKIRLEVTGHGYETGDTVSVSGVGGVPASEGQWTITVVDDNHFDLDGSTWGGAFTSGGLCVRYFGGGRFGTIAIGNSFADYKLRAFKNGDLRIRNAEIELTKDVSGTIRRILLDPAGPEFLADTDGSTPWVKINPEQVEVRADLTNGYMGLLAVASGTASLSLVGDASSGGAQVGIATYGGSTVNGPEISFLQHRGTGASPSPTQTGDLLMQLVSSGDDGAGGFNRSAVLKAVATENHAVGAHGAKFVIQVTPNGSAVPTDALTIDQDGSVTVAGTINASGGIGGGVTGSLALSVLTTTLQYKDWAGVNQSRTVVTGVTLTPNGFTNGIRTT